MISPIKFLSLIAAFNANTSLSICGSETKVESGRDRFIGRIGAQSATVFFGPSLFLAGKRDTGEINRIVSALQFESCQCFASAEISFIPRLENCFQCTHHVLA